MQATFVECVGSAPVAPQLAACVLELVRSPGVHGHSQPYVRRSALLASAQVGAANPGLIVTLSHTLRPYLECSSVLHLLPF